jgi:uncharacterized protein
MLTLYETSGDSARLDQALLLPAKIAGQFVDADHGGFFYTAADHEPLIVRKKDCIDSPTPSGNGLAAMLYLRLHSVTGEDGYRTIAEAALQACVPFIGQMPMAACQLLLAMESQRKGVRSIFSATS